MIKDLVVKLGGIRLKPKQNPAKEQIIIEGIDDGGSALSELSTNLPVLLEKFVESIRKQGGIGKVYVTLPVEEGYVSLAEKANFEKEAVYPRAFFSPDSRIVNGIDMVYFLDEKRRMSDEERGNIERMLWRIYRHSKTKLSIENRLYGPKESRAEDIGYTFRKGGIEDSEQIAAIWKGAFLCNDDHPNGLEPKDVAESFKDENRIWAVCEKEGQIVGIASAYLNDGSLSILGYRPRTLEIEDCAVKENHREKGIMGELVKLLSREIKQHNQVPCAYCTTEDEGMHRVLASLEWVPTGISESTNHILLAGQDVKKPSNIKDVPYSSNVVWFPKS